MTPAELRELLTLAARAAGKTILHWTESGRPLLDSGVMFVPHEDDGEALRLAIALHMHIAVESHAVTAWCPSRRGSWFCSEDTSEDARASTRLAILRAAADVGRNMP